MRATIRARQGGTLRAYLWDGEAIGGSLDATDIRSGNREITVRVDSQFRPIEGRTRKDIRDLGQTLHLRRKLECDIRHRRVIVPGDDDGDIALAVLVEEPITNIGNVRHIEADRVLKLLLRHRTF